MENSCAQHNDKSYGKSTALGAPFVPLVVCLFLSHARGKACRPIIPAQSIIHYMDLNRIILDSRRGFHSRRCVGPSENTSQIKISLAIVDNGRCCYYVHMVKDLRLLHLHVARNGHGAGPVASVCCAVGRQCPECVALRKPGRRGLQPSIINKIGFKVLHAGFETCFGFGWGPRHPKVLGFDSKTHLESRRLLARHFDYYTV